MIKIMLKAAKHVEGQGILVSPAIAASACPLAFEAPLREFPHPLPQKIWMPASIALP